MTPTDGYDDMDPYRKFKHHYRKFFKLMGIDFFQVGMENRIWLDGRDHMPAVWLDFESFSDMKKYVYKVAPAEKQFLTLLSERL